MVCVRRCCVAILVTVSLGLLVAGCGMTRLTRPWAEPHAARSLWSYAGAGQVFLVEVHQPPPGLTPQALAAAVPSPPSSAPAARFTADAAQAARPDYRFVLVFGAGAGDDGADACAGRTAPGGEGAVVQAAFCHRDRVLAEVRAEALGDSFAKGAVGPAGRALLYDIVRHLVPPPEVDFRDLPDPPPV